MGGFACPCAAVCARCCTPSAGVRACACPECRYAWGGWAPLVGGNTHEEATDDFAAVAIGARVLGEAAAAATAAARGGGAAGAPMFIGGRALGALRHAFLRSREAPDEVLAAAAACAGGGVGLPETLRVSGSPTCRGTVT